MENYILISALLITTTVLFFFLWQKNRDSHTAPDSIKDLEQRLTGLMLSALKEIRDTESLNSKNLQDRVYSFAKEATQIKADLKQVQEAVKGVSSFQEIFRSPKLRGQWGEASLEHILAQHFPSELYKIQHLFSSGERVDAVLKLPNGRLLPIDSKFPSENFAKMLESPEADRSSFQKRFVEDVKARINEIASKYILPPEGTLDFALMYVPAEAVYYEIINNIGKETDLAEYAWSKKVVLTSPNTIYLSLRTIDHWVRDTQVSRQTQEILKRLDKVHQDAGRLTNDFRKLGSHLRNAVSSYDSSEKRLSLFSERVDRILENKQTKKLKQS